MLQGATLGALEVRAEAGVTRLRARFPYGSKTELAPYRHEVIEARAFARRINSGSDIHLLAGHDYNKPLASVAAGTLTLRDTDQALELEAQINASTSWARDFLAAHEGGLVRGLSPGFRVTEGGERIERRGRDTLRTITQADLFEVSAVTVPAYSDALVEARNWVPGGQTARAAHALARWRL